MRCAELNIAFGGWYGCAALGMMRNVHHFCHPLIIGRGFRGVLGDLGRMRCAELRNLARTSGVSQAVCCHDGFY